MPSLLSGLPRTREAVSLAPGAVWLKNWLSLDEQSALVERCRAIMDGPGGGYVPTVRGGGKMHVRMTCLGRHWNPLTYQYVSTRADHDDAPVAPVPEEWAALASALAREAGFECRPDICLIARGSSATMRANVRGGTRGSRNGQGGLARTGGQS